MEPSGLFEKFTRQCNRRGTGGVFASSCFISGRGANLATDITSTRRGAVTLSHPSSFDLCITVPFYPSQYDCYSFMSRSARARDTGGAVPRCIGLLYRRLHVANGVTGRTGLELRDMCFNNKAPASLSTSRLAVLFSTIERGFSLSAYERCAIRTNEPSAVARRGLLTVGGNNTNEVDVGPRAFDSRILGGVNEHRSTGLAERGFLRTHSVKFSGVGASLVTKLPNSACRNFYSSLAGALRLSPRGVAMRALTLGHTSGLNARVNGIGARGNTTTSGVLSFTCNLLANGNCFPCCVCHRSGALGGLRGAKCTGGNERYLCGVFVVRRYRDVFTIKTKTIAGVYVPRGGRVGQVFGFGCPCRCVSEFSVVGRQGGRVSTLLAGSGR